MNIFFDVDETIQAYDGSLRPFVVEAFRQLVADGHQLYVWSGARTARSVREGVVGRHVLTPYVVDCFQKPIVNPRWAWSQTGIDVQPDVCVDDREETIAAFGGIIVAPYPYPGPDEEMKRVYKMISSTCP